MLSQDRERVVQVRFTFLAPFSALKAQCGTESGLALKGNLLAPCEWNNRVISRPLTLCGFERRVVNAEVLQAWRVCVPPSSGANPLPLVAVVFLMRTVASFPAAFRFNDRWFFLSRKKEDGRISVTEEKQLEGAAV